MSATRPGDPRQVGPYRIVGRLGAGGMGQVLLGRSPAGRTVAVKVIHPAMAEDEDFRARFRREITAARAVGGVYTAPVVDADPDASPPWLATAFLRGMSLQDAVAAHGPLPPPAVRALGAALAEALRSVHGAGIVHRDLKPSNVMLTPEGPRVIDFGIARPSEATTLTRTGATLGTPAYMSPEQASGQPAGPPSDVFSLGAVLTYAATGIGPFGQGAVHELVYRVLHLPPYLDGVADPGLRALIAACMEKDPARRPTPEQLLEQLSAEPAPAPQGTYWLPPPVAHDVARRGEATVPSGPSRRTFLALGAGCALSAAAVGGGTLMLFLRRDDGPLRWSFRLPEGTYVRARLVASGGTVLAFGSKTLSGETFALDAATGKQRWRGGFTVPRGSSPALLDGRGYVYDQPGGRLLTGFDLATGRTLWTERLETSGLGPRPVAGAGVVCITGYADTGEYGLYGFDAATGRPRWRYRSDELVQTRAVLAGGTCWFGTRQGFVYAVDVATGNARWQKRTGAAVMTDPVPAGDVLAVLTADGAVLGLDAATGRERWRADLGDEAATDAHEGLPAGIAGGVLFVDGLNGMLYAVDPSTGRVRWKQKAGTAGERTTREFSLPAVGGGLAVVTDEDWIAALDLATGEIRWERGVDGGSGEQPVISGSLVYYGTGRGMQVFDLRTGRTRHNFEFDGIGPVLGAAEFCTELGGTVYCVIDGVIVQAIRVTE